MKAPSAEEIDKLKQQHGVVELWQIWWGDEDGENVFLAKMPSDDEWGRFVALQGDDDTKNDGFKGLVFGSIVYPANIPTLLKERPGLALTLGNKIAEYAGLVKRAEGKVV